MDWGRCNPGSKRKASIGPAWVTSLQVGAGGTRGHSSSPSPTEAYEVEGLFPTVERSVLIRRRGKECWVDGNYRSSMVDTQAGFR